MAGLRHVEHVMGMAVSVDVRDDLAERGPAALDEVVAWLHHVDATYSTYLADSVISRFGRGELAVDDLDDEVAGVLARCEAVKVATGGAFDIHAVPTPNGTHLDPSGLVKGWAVEQAAEILRRAGAANLCINAGGDLAIRGEPSPGTPWRVGIRHPTQADRLATVVQARGPIGIATSATYERGAHIVDPRTGAPTAELASATIVGPDLTDADAFATAVFVLGLDGLLWLDEHPAADGYEGFVITHDEQTFATQGFARYR
jgi:thiamine biosynthesis lipoprotein